MRLLALTMAIMVGACAGYEPMERTRIDDVPPGRGLLTGERGAFYILGGPSAPATKEDGKKTSK